MSIMGDKKTGRLLGIWKSVLGFILSEPRILIPFFILAVCETLLLWILANSPHFPFSFVFAPPIRRIWGDIYLHYPYIFELLPRIFYFMKIVLSIFVGSLTTGMAIHLILASDKNEPIDLKKTFFFVFKRYLSLMLLAAVLFITVHFVMKQPAIIFFNYFKAGHAKLLFLGPKFWFGMFLPAVSFFMAVVLQAIFVYSFPYVVIKGKKFLVALVLGVKLFLKNWLKTLVVVTIPMLLYIPVTMLRNNSAVLADKFSPEIVVSVLFVGIIIGTVVVDALVTIVTTLLFIEATEHEN